MDGCILLASSIIKLELIIINLSTLILSRIYINFFLYSLIVFILHCNFFQYLFSKCFISNHCTRVKLNSDGSIALNTHVNEAEGLGNTLFTKVEVKVFIPGFHLFSNFVLNPVELHTFFECFTEKGLALSFSNEMEEAFISSDLSLDLLLSGLSVFVANV